MSGSPPVVLFSSDDGVLFDMTVDGRAGEFGLTKHEFAAALRRPTAYRAFPGWADRTRPRPGWLQTWLQK